MDVAFAHPIKMIANALGVPPRYMLELGKANNVAVAALVGAKEHALKQAEAGVDVIVVQGTEAGGHCGEVSTMVLVPEVCEAIKEFKDISVLAAGGIVLGPANGCGYDYGRTWRMDGVYVANHLGSIHFTGD